MRFGDPRVHALLHALLIHRLLPHGITNHDLRTLIGTKPEDITAGKITYDLRRLRAHGLIHRIPHTRCYQITDTGLLPAARIAMLAVAHGYHVSVLTHPVQRPSSPRGCFASARSTAPGWAARNRAAVSMHSTTLRGIPAGAEVGSVIARTTEPASTQADPAM